MKLILRKVNQYVKHSSPPRLIAFGFASVILVGAILLMLPVSVRDDQTVSFIDALFTSTSAVCVTGLIAIDTAEHFTVFGRTVVALLIQIGGLGVTCVGVTIILAAGKRVGFKVRKLIKESWNIGGYGGLVKLVKYVLKITLLFELVGAILSFIVFVQDYPPLDALGISLFHSVAAFNNSGFDILGGLTNLIPYQNDILLNLVTSGLIIFGGIGFLVIIDVKNKKSFKKLTFHSKAVISVSIALIVIGTLLIKLTENVTWLGAFFQSVSARTAGFSTYNLGNFTNAGLFVLVILMFIGASPGSTGGGIKTSTLFVIGNVMKSIMTHQHCVSFKRRISEGIIMQAFVVAILSLCVVIISTFLLCIVEPRFTFMQLLFESTSAFGTVGLSTGITSHLSVLGKIIIILTMYIGRIGTKNSCIFSRRYYDRIGNYMTNEKSYAIIGLGRFGMPLAKKLAEAGKEVIGIDRDEDRVKELREYTEYAFVSQTLTKDVLEEVGVQNCDVVIVCIGERIEVSILTTLNVINLGVSKVIAKATNADQGEVLEKLGAQVVYPERDMALRLAKKILRENLVDYISIGKDIEIIEFEISKQMIGKSIIGMRVRENFGLNIIAIHHDGITDTDIDPHYLLKAGDTIAVIGKENKVAQFVDSYS